MKRAERWLAYKLWLAVLLVGTVGVAGCGSGTVSAPTTFAEYNSPRGTFACEYPEGWEKKGSSKSGGGGLEWATFTSGPAEIRVEAGAAGSLVGDIAKNLGGQQGDLGPESEPVHSVHLAGVKSAEGEFNGYQEVAGPDVIDVRLGPARRSEFTAATSFGSGMRGYRATALGRDKAVYVYCVCPEANWAALQPAFDRVLSSLRRGQAQ